VQSAIRHRIAPGRAQGRRIEGDGDVCRKLGRGGTHVAGAPGAGGAAAIREAADRQFNGSEHDVLISRRICAYHSKTRAGRARGDLAILLPATGVEVR